MTSLKKNYVYLLDVLAVKKHKGCKTQTAIDIGTAFKIWTAQDQFVLHECCLPP